jgi:hypothetical protein
MIVHLLAQVCDFKAFWVFFTHSKKRACSEAQFHVFVITVMNPNNLDTITTLHHFLHS